VASDDDPTADMVQQVRATQTGPAPAPPLPGGGRPLQRLEREMHGPMPTPEPPGIWDQLKQFFVPPTPEQERARAIDVSPAPAPFQVAQAGGLSDLYAAQPPGGGNEFAGHLDAIGKRFPALAPHLGNVVVQRGQAPQGGADRVMEFYPPWERDNPNQGKTTLQLYEGAGNDPGKVQSLMAADMMHLLGSVDPRSGQPVDPAFRQLKQELAASLTKEQITLDQRLYQKQFGSGPRPSFEDWMDHTGTDAYVRGGLFPEVNPEWQRPGTFTPQQQQILDRMRNHLAGGVPVITPHSMRPLVRPPIGKFRQPPPDAPPEPGEELFGKSPAELRQLGIKPQ